MSGAVSSVDKVQRYWANTSRRSTCKSGSPARRRSPPTTPTGVADDEPFSSLEWVENIHDFGPMKHTVSDFVAYQESVYA